MMRSHLTRGVFRSILVNEPFVTSSCLRQARTWRYSSKGSVFRNGLSRRPIFGFAIDGLKARRQDYTQVRGKTLMTSKVVGNLISAQRQNLRPPARAEVAAVLKTFFQSLSASTPLTEYDITFTNVALKYVKSKDDLEKERKEPSFSEGNLHNLLLALTAGAVKFQKVGNEAKELADLVLRDLVSESEEHDSPVDGSAVMQTEYAPTYVKLLAATGHGQQALQLVRSSQASDRLWIELLSSTAERRQDEELVEYINAMFAESVQFERNDWQRLIAKIANSDLAQSSKRAYELAIESGFKPTYETKVRLLEFCIRNREVAWGQPIFETVDLEADDKIRRLSYLWSAAQGTPSEEIIVSLEEHLSQDEDIAKGRKGRYTLATVNGLVKYANSVKDTKSAEKYLQLIPTWGFQPNATTRLVEFEHYLATRNIDAALEACYALHDQPFTPEKLDGALEALQNEDAAIHEDVILLNKLIGAVCTMERPNYELAMNLLDMLLEKTPSLQSGTVAALVGVLLTRGEYQEVHDLLESHHPLFSKMEREEVRKVVVDFILDPEKDVMQAWHAYDMFRNVFSDTPIGIREDIMKSFFARKRSDLACLVFGHMRQMQNPAYRPTADLYTECFKGIAACEDIKAAELVHNMLKLDIYVDPNTRLLTAVMLAWANAGEAWRSLQIFDDILQTAEGPSNTTLAVLFRACEKFAPTGQAFAMHYMARLKGGGFEITKEVYQAYIGAIAGNGDYNGTVELVENMEAETGHPPDAVTLGIAYNTLIWLNQSMDFELWAQEKFPEQWNELDTIGELEPEASGERYFLIDTTIDI